MDENGIWIEGPEDGEEDWDWDPNSPHSLDASCCFGCNADDLHSNAPGLCSMDVSEGSEPAVIPFDWLGLPPELR